MDVWRMRMIVLERRVTMEVGVRSWPFLTRMLVGVMRIVDVLVRMLERAVTVAVIVALAL